MSHSVTRFRSRKTMGGEDVREFFYQLLDLLRSRQESNAPESWLWTFRSSEDDGLRAVGMDHTTALNVDEKVEVL